MSGTFVWFHHSSENGKQSADFYGKLLGWQSSEGPGGMTMLSAGEAPFAATGERYGDASGWVPFVQVDDVDAATRNALALGGTIVREKAKGPAGDYSVVRDPAGAAIALWQKA